MNFIICNTAYQLLTALNLSTKMLDPQKTILGISDHFNSKECFTLIKCENLFYDAIYIKSNGFNRISENSTGLKQRLKRFQEISKVDDFVRRLPDVTLDTFYFVNRDWFSICLFSKLKKRNRELIAYQFEDGYSTYTLEPIRLNSIAKKLYYRVFGLDALFNSIKGIYLYEPKLLCTELDAPVLPIPKIDKADSDFINLIKRVFNINHVELKKKYIFFEECFQADHVRNNDVEIIKEVIKLVGNENITVKQHPRNTKSRFDDSVDYCTIPFPWEAYALTNDISDKVLISIYSGATISPKIVFNDSSNVIFLYNMLLGDHPTVHHGGFDKYIIKLVENYRSEIYIPDNFEELKAHLMKLGNT